MLFAFFALAAVASDIDDAARYFAGLPGRADGPHRGLEADPLWQAHARSMDESWQRFARRRKGAMERFAAAELADLSSGDVVYPFSGPDVLTMVTFLPGHARYVMLALEPPGTVPKPSALARRLPEVAETVASVFAESFFVTRDMDRELRGQVSDGVMLPILIQLARLGYTIEGVRYLQLDPQGKLLERAEAKRAAFGYGLSVALDVTREGKHSEIIYISVNLDDAHVKNDAGLVALMRAASTPTMMLKATSYMTQDDAFVRIRELITETANAIVQDDSGIAWRHLESWDVRLYGAYKKPYGSFAFRVQDALRQQYTDKKPTLLDFAIGYGAGRVDSNLQVARKRH